MHPEGSRRLRRNRARWYPSLGQDRTRNSPHGIRGAFNCHKRRVFLDEVAPEDRSVQLALAAVCLIPTAFVMFCRNSCESLIVRVPDSKRIRPAAIPFSALRIIVRAGPCLKKSR
jgi:hypothetical protein